MKNETISDRQRSLRYDYQLNITINDICKGYGSIPLYVLHPKVSYCSKKQEEHSVPLAFRKAQLINSSLAHSYPGFCLNYKYRRRSKKCRK